MRARKDAGSLAQDGGFLAIEFFFGQSAFVAELLKLAQLLDNAVLGVGGWVVRRVIAGVPAVIRGCPNETDDPGDTGPAQ